MLLLNIGYCVAFILISNWLRNIYKHRKILSEIPAPPGHWFLGNMKNVLENPSPGGIFNLVRDCSQKYWPIYRITTPYVVTVNILHPSDFEIILSQMKHLQKSKIYSFLESWLGKGLLTSTGLKWQKRRKLLTRAFHFNILQRFVQIFNDETQNMVKQIKNINAQSNTLESIDIIPIITKLTLQSITETSLGISDIEEETVKTYRKNIYKMGSFVLDKIFSPWKRMSLFCLWSKDANDEKATITSLHEFTYRVIRERENQILNQKSENLIPVSYSGKKIMKMLDLLLDEKINEKSIDYEGIREEVDTFMFEGHDTTSAALSFLLYSLAQHPAIQEKVRTEINSLLQAKDKIPSFRELQEMPYTERVIKETLRLYPSVPFISRISSEDFVSSTGYFIPKGTVLHMHIFDLHRNADIYPEPLKFDPDRFLPENYILRHPFAYLPFSAGPRNCIGQKFAMLEIKAAICGILRNFKLVEDPTTNINFMADLVLRVEGKMKIKFVPLSDKECQK